MGKKKRFNGYSPEKRIKGVSGIPLKQEEWAKLDLMADEMDCTLGYAVAKAIKTMIKDWKV